MTIREKIILEIKDIGNPAILQQIFEFLELLRREFMPYSIEQNRDEVLKFAGILNHEEAEELKKDLGEEFDHLEGEW